VTAGEYNTIQLVSNYVIVILLASVIILFIIDMLHSERIKVLKKTIETKEVRIVVLETNQNLGNEIIHKQEEEIDLLEIKLEKYKEAFLGFSNSLVDSMGAVDIALRNFALPRQSELAEKLEERIWNQEIEQEQK